VRIVELQCEECAEVRDFEQPPCLDGHGADCDEWVCTGCGSALLIASFPAVQLRGRRARGHAPRRAA